MYVHKIYKQQQEHVINNKTKDLNYTITTKLYYVIILRYNCICITYSQKLMAASEPQTSKKAHCIMSCPFFVHN